MVDLKTEKSIKALAKVLVLFYPENIYIHYTPTYIHELIVGSNRRSNRSAIFELDDLKNAFSDKSLRKIVQTLKCGKFEFPNDFSFQSSIDGKKMGIRFSIPS